MTCYRCRDLLSAYIDAELTFRQAARVREHLRVCARCRAEHDDFERINAVAREDPIPPVPPELRERVRRAVVAEGILPRPAGVFPGAAGPPRGGTPGRDGSRGRDGFRPSAPWLGPALRLRAVAWAAVVLLALLAGLGASCLRTGCVSSSGGCRCGGGCSCTHR